MVALLLASGCVTPAATKEASRAHGQNLADLKSAVESYKKALADYFTKLEAQQREAYIAYMVGWEIDQFAKDQFQSVQYTQGWKDFSLRFNGPVKQTRSPSDSTAHDFITLGEGISNSYGTWGRSFDARLLLLERLEREKAELEKLKSVPEPEKDESAIAKKEKEIDQLSANLEQLSKTGQDEESRSAPGMIVGTAANLRRTARTLDGKLKHLLVQIEVMQRFHGVIDTYLGIDATIDGKVVADAAENGASIDLSEFPELKKMLDELRKK